MRQVNLIYPCAQSRALHLHVGHHISDRYVRSRFDVVCDVSNSDTSLIYEGMLFKGEKGEGENSDHFLDLGSLAFW